jgi:hypothetical protein
VQASISLSDLGWAGKKGKACMSGRKVWCHMDGLLWTASSGIQNGGTLFLSLGAAVDQEEGQPSNAPESLGPNCPVGAWERDDEYSVKLSAMECSSAPFCVASDPRHFAWQDALQLSAAVVSEFLF